MDELLTAETKNFLSIISESKKICVPMYQRAYSWTEQEWEELFEDILNDKKNKSKHYMGALVFINRPNGTFEVVDGQQRLTTITIMIHAVIKILNFCIENDINKDANIQRKDIVKNYIGKKSSIDLTWENKLELNEENNKFYNTYIMNFEHAKVIPNKITSTNKLLIQCQEYFYNRILEYVKVSEIKKITDKKIVTILQLVEYIVENLIFVRIVATNELSAYTIFETLNDRGIDLSITDLLKNYLLSIFKRKNDREIAKNMWDSAIEKIELKNFPTFLRHYWMIENKLVRKDNLFKEIKNKINDKKNALTFLNNLNYYAEIYAALSDENSDFWKESQKLKEHIQNLKILKVKQCYPLLMATIKFIDKKYWQKIFFACEVISFRYLTICGKNPNALEDVYNKICNEISSKTIKTYNDVKNQLITSSIYIKNDEFISNFSNKIINTKSNQRIAKYILIKINADISEEHTVLKIDDSNLTLEHILPENPNDEWKKVFSKDEILDSVYRIGNFTLLSSSKNRKIGNEEYEKKKNTYRCSEILMTKNIEKYYPTWNVESIQKRQEEMAKKAVNIWNL